MVTRQSSCDGLRWSTNGRSRQRTVHHLCYVLPPRRTTMWHLRLVSPSQGTSLLRLMVNFIPATVTSLFRLYLPHNNFSSEIPATLNHMTDLFLDGRWWRGQIRRREGIMKKRKKIVRGYTILL